MIALGALDNFSRATLWWERHACGVDLFFQMVAREVDTVVAPAVKTVKAEESREVSEWLQAARGGNGEAFRRVIETYQPLMTKRMCRFTRDRVQLEELVQEVFVEAYFSLKRFRGDAPFEHWLQGIATRVGFQFWKRQKRERARAEKLQQRAMEAPSSAGELGEGESQSTFGDASQLLEKLSARDRLVLTLIYLEGRSVEEAAKLSGWSKTMVKVQAFRARAKLRKLIEEEKGHV